MTFYAVTHPLGRFITQAEDMTDATRRFGTMSLIQEVTESFYVHLRDDEGVPEL